MTPRQMFRVSNLASHLLLKCCLPALAGILYQCSTASFWPFSPVYAGRTTCLAVDSVGVDPAEPAVPAEANLWPEGPEPFHKGGTGRRCRNGERKILRILRVWFTEKSCCAPRIMCTSCVYPIRWRYPILMLLCSGFLRSHAEKGAACQNPCLFPKPQLISMSGRRKM